MPRSLFLSLTDRDLQAVEGVARASRTPSNEVLGGFVRLCWFTFMEDRSTVSQRELAVFFDPGVNPNHLRFFGLVEATGDGYRVPGRPRVESKRVPPCRCKSWRCDECRAFVGEC